MCGTVRTQLLENAASFLGSQQDVITQFQAAIASNLTVVRMFGHGVATGFYLQNPAAMGTYNEQAFRAFDYVLDQAARHQLKLVISFADNWDTDSNSDNKCARPPTSPLGHSSGSWASQASCRMRLVSKLGKGPEHLRKRGARPGAGLGVLVDTGLCRTACLVSPYCID